MDGINHPRSITKAVAITAITLTVAAFATALGIGMRAVLWEIGLVRAEFRKADALVDQAHAAQKQAEATFLAAVEQAKGAIASAERQAIGNIESARLQANATIRAAEVGNISDILTTNKVTAPAILDPFNRHTILSDRIEVLKDEIAQASDHRTQRPLTATEVQAKQAELELAGRQLRLVQNQISANFRGIGTTTIDSLSGITSSVLDRARPTLSGPALSFRPKQ